jgi:hypothetical protein
VEKLVYEDTQLPDTEDLNQAQTDKEFAIRKRITDLASWGVLHSNAYPAGLVVPVSSQNPAPNAIADVGEFTLTFDTNLGTLSVGKGSQSTGIPYNLGGVGYDLNGQRVAIPTDLQWGSTASSAGLKSSGNLLIPLTLSGSTPALGTYYAWIQYLLVNDPNYPVVIYNNGSPITTYPHMLDGYQILLTSTPAAPLGDGLSLFLGKIVWAAAFPEVLVVTQGVKTAESENGNLVSTVPQVSGDPGRMYFGVRSHNVEVVLDPANPTATYGSNLLMTLFDHCNALGTGTLGPNNPHRIGAADIAGLGAEPIAVSNQSNSLAKGITDLSLNSSGMPNISQNSPAALSLALKPSMGAGTLTPAGLDTTALANQGAGSSGISQGVQAAWVRIGWLQANMMAYVLGVGLSQVYPTVRQTADHLGDSSIVGSLPTSGDGWVGFSNSGTIDTAGVYRIFGSQAPLSGGGSVLLLQKQLLPGWPAVIPTEAVGNLTVALVYWDGTNLWQTPQAVNGSQPTDLRSLGLVGNQQLSTVAKGSADNGILSQQAFSNLVANPAYAIAVSATAGVSEVQMGSGAFVQSGASQTASTDPTMAAPPVGAITDRVWTINPGAAGALSASYVFHALAGLRPDSSYGISFYYKAASTFNGRFRVGMADGANISPDSLMSLDGVTALAPVDINVLNDGNWHRASIVVKSLATVNPNNGVQSKFLEFVFEQGSGASLASTFAMTNIQVTQGEWVPGYQAGGRIPTGMSMFTDVLTTCPPGSVENTNLRGTFPIGYQPSGTGTNGLENIGTTLGTPATNGSQIGYHQHSSAMTSQGNVASGGSAISVPNIVNPLVTSLNQANIASRVGMWCLGL